LVHPPIEGKKYDRFAAIPTSQTATIRIDSTMMRNWLCFMEIGGCRPNSPARPTPRPRLSA